MQREAAGPFKEREYVNDVSEDETRNFYIAGMIHSIFRADVYRRLFEERKSSYVDVKFTAEQKFS